MVNDVSLTNVQPSPVELKQNTGHYVDNNCKYVINDTPSDKFEYVTRAKKGKKWCIGLMSTFSPGVGYFANGQLGKALLTILGIGAGGFASFAGMTMIKNRAVGIGTAIAGGVLALGTYIASIVGSVKNADKNVEIIKRTIDRDGFVIESKVNQ